MIEASTTESPSKPWTDARASTTAMRSDARPMRQVPDGVMVGLDARADEIGGVVMSIGQFAQREVGQRWRGGDATGVLHRLHKQLHVDRIGKVTDVDHGRVTGVG